MGGGGALEHQKSKARGNWASKGGGEGGLSAGGAEGGAARDTAHVFSLPNS
jgi:hypothetical protein